MLHDSHVRDSCTGCGFGGGWLRLSMYPHAFTFRDSYIIRYLSLCVMTHIFVTRVLGVVFVADEYDFASHIRTRINWSWPIYEYIYIGCIYRSWLIYVVLDLYVYILMCGSRTVNAGNLYIWVTIHICIYRYISITWLIYTVRDSYILTHIYSSWLITTVRDSYI